MNKYVYWGYLTFQNVASLNILVHDAINLLYHTILLFSIIATVTNTNTGNNLETNLYIESMMISFYPVVMDSIGPPEIKEW